MVEKSRRDVLKFSGAALGGIAVGSTVTAAESTDRFIVQVNGTSATDLTDAGLSVVHDLSEAGLFVVAGAERDLKGVTSSYEPDVEIAIDGDVERLSASKESAADEPGYGVQWDKQAQNISEVHETTTGDGSRVAIIDSGVAAGHPDLDVNEDLSRNFTGDGLGAANPAGGYHGTHVGGIVAAQDNGEGVIGTAPDTDLVDCRVFSPSALASFGDILAAIVYSAAIGADAANLSLGAYPVPRQALGEFYGKALNRVMTYANSKGTLLVVAAGNDAADLQHDKNLISIPNEGAQAVSVSATGTVGFGFGDPGPEQPPDTPAKYTNYGTNAITVSAPGGNYDAGFPEGWFFDLVYNTVAIPTYETNADDKVVGLADVNYTYSWIAGTSMAAPQVAGAAALVKSVAPDLNANDVESVLKDTAADAPGGKEYHGAGFLNPVGALDSVK